MYINYHRDFENIYFNLKMLHNKKIQGPAYASMSFNWNNWVSFFKSILIRRKIK